jgi:hypothetical protein
MGSERSALPETYGEPAAQYATGGAMGSDLWFRIFVVALGLLPVALVALVTFMR